MKTLFFTKHASARCQQRVLADIATLFLTIELNLILMRTKGLLLPTIALKNTRTNFSKSFFVNMKTNQRTAIISRMHWYCDETDKGSKIMLLHSENTERIKLQF